jgi:hypothetical protein
MVGGFMTNVNAVCNYCKTVHPLNSGVVMEGLYFHNIHCYILWKDRQEVDKQYHLPFDEEDNFYNNGIYKGGGSP